eukprot:5746962-Amphidinium_carterae.1
MVLTYFGHVCWLSCARCFLKTTDCSILAVGTTSVFTLQIERLISRRKRPTSPERSLPSNQSYFTFLQISKKLFDIARNN